MTDTLNPKKKLPIGIQTFREIREDNYYYVDKTPYSLQIIEQGKYYFLSRPRRFGKSLFLDTLAELFASSQELFTGLYAENHWDWSRKSPVIRFSFGGGIVNSQAELDLKIQEQLTINQQALEITCTQTTVAACLAELIREAHAATGERVVVLVDEYDKPILDNLEQPETAKIMREGLRNLYSVIKDMDAHIRFAMLTGVSKFSKVSLFSGLNNLQDITVSKEYSALCGYTDTDIDTVFAPELQGLDRQKIREWYNGYSWSGESVYNPFDILLLFSEGLFKPYWFETGTPTFLIKLLSQRGFFTPNLAKQQTSLDLLSAFDVDHINSDALLFQTGYLTLSKVEEIVTGFWVYTLGYPNKEVETSLNSALLSGYGADGQKAFTNRLRLLQLLQAVDCDGLKELFNAFFSSIPHDWYRNNPIAQYEGYYASIFYSHFAALGLPIILEDTTNQGRIDMSVRFNEHIYLFEFKVVEQVPEGKALQQLKDKAYADKYRDQGEMIHLIGVEFSKEQRSVVGFEFEDL